MKTNNNSKDSILCQKAEELLPKQAPENALKLSENETLKLIQKLEDNQLKMITLRQKLRLAKEQTQASIQKYNELFDLMPLGYFILSRYGEIIETNACGSHMLGKELMYLGNSNFRLYITDETKPIFDIFLRNTFCNQTDETCGVTLLSPDKLPIYVHLSGHVTKNGEQCMVSMVDITERKQSEKKLKLLSRAMEQSPVTVVITDKEGNIEYTNPKFTEITGYTQNEVLDQNPRILQSGKQSSEIYNELWQTLLSGNDWYGEFQNRKKNGDLYWESAVISSIVNDSGDIAYFIAVKEDITEKKQMIADLIKAKEKAEESDRLKSAFLANMSHEIRTPMNGILGFTDLLKEPGLSGKAQKEYINIIELSGARMLDTINNIVDISKIESGQTTVSISETNIHELIEHIYSFFEPAVEQKGILFSLKNYLHANDAIIRTDQEKVYVILSNLVKNAIKFTNEGSIEIGYNISKTCQHPELMFYVKDTGIGIHPENINVIFERFRQGSESLSRNYEGAGLGLSISKAYVEMLRGRIWVESEEGKGSKFYFTVPMFLNQS